jgi:ATP-binding cassette, subfamily B, bacterial
VAAVIAVVIMARINLTITLVIFVPLFSIILITRLAWGRIIRLQPRQRRAADAVSGYLERFLTPFRPSKWLGLRKVWSSAMQLNETSRRMQTRESMFRSVLDALNSSVVTFGIGVMLLMAGTAISQGDFTVGDFALFVSYLWFTTQVPSELGTFYGDYKVQEVSIDRLLDMIRPEQAEALVEYHPVYAQWPLPPACRFRPQTASDRLERLEVRGLTYHFPMRMALTDSGGLRMSICSLERGEFVVVTGRIGSGKSTLVRVLLGLLPKQAGEIYWNGRLVEDPSTFFRPPRCAYTAQVPRLFSDSLRENILMGLDESQVDLPSALHLSVLEPDLLALEKGLDTSSVRKVCAYRAVRCSVQRRHVCSCANPNCWSSMISPAHWMSRRSKSCGSGWMNAVKSLKKVSPAWSYRTAALPCAAPTASLC